MYGRNAVPVVAVSMLMASGLAACGPSNARARVPAAADAPAAKPELTLVEPRSEPEQVPPAGLLVLEAEIARAMTALRSRGQLAPYFISIQLTDEHAVRIAATNGSVTFSNSPRARIFATDVRVGGYELDSTHPLGDEYFEESGFALGPMDAANDDVLRRIAWRQIDSNYRTASERFLAVKSQAQLKVGIDDKSGDFSRETPTRYIGAPARPPEVAITDWESKTRALSARLRDKPAVHSGTVAIDGSASTRWIVNSEGSRIQTGEHGYRLTIAAETRADDGMELSRSEVFAAASPDGLPPEQTLNQAVDRIAEDLAALRRAKTAEPFVGPAILTARAAAVYFHETLGHRVEGERQKLDEEGQTFAKKIGERVMSPFIDVYDDPRLARLGAADLAGFYRFDDEGVPAQRALLVQGGVLKGFLTSRVPVRGIVKSNGHGRRTHGAARARQANLIVEPSRTVSSSELRRLLVSEARRQNKTYGLVFAEIEGGYAETVRESTQGFKLLPVMVYRVFVDGRPDELIRGVDIIGTPLTSLTKILAAGDDFGVFNGSCGAESGWVPVSAVSPSLLLQQIEVALRDKGSAKPPVLPPPPVSADAVRPPTSETKEKQPQ
jgi:TldD protein